MFKRIDIKKALLTKSLRFTGCPCNNKKQMTINLPFVEGTIEGTTAHTQISEIRSTFYTENALHKLLCRPKDQVATD